MADGRCALHLGPALRAGAGRVQGLRPFWEFVSGPPAAGGFPANALDDTFGPDRVFVRAPERANVSPMESPQFFGEVEIDGDSAELTVRLRAEGGSVLFTEVLRPGHVGQRAAVPGIWPKTTIGDQINT